MTQPGRPGSGRDSLDKPSGRLSQLHPDWWRCQIAASSGRHCRTAGPSKLNSPFRVLLPCSRSLQVNLKAVISRISPFAFSLDWKGRRYFRVYLASNQVPSLTDGHSQTEWVNILDGVRMYPFGYLAKVGS